MRTPTHLDDDLELVARMVTGDEYALAELYDRHCTSVMTIAYAILGNRPDAEEAVSDAFVQAWTQADRYDAARGGVTAWLHTMVRSRALDRARKTGRHARLAARARSRVEGTEGEAATANPGGLPAAELPDSDPEGIARRQQTRAAVQRAIRELPEEQARAIELAWLAGLTHRQVAEALDEPLGTVKTRIRAGMEKLRRSLSAYGAMTDR